MHWMRWFFSELRANWKRPANLVTESRLVLSPLIGILVLVDYSSITLRWIATVLFVVVVATDALDGYLARHLGQVSELGKFLDPTVDKVLIILTFLALSIINPWLWFATIVIAAREVAVTILRIKAQRRGADVAASRSGKLKMVAQSIALALLLAPFPAVWEVVPLLVVVIALILTVTSWVEYHLKFSRTS